MKRYWKIDSGIISDDDILEAYWDEYVARESAANKSLGEYEYTDVNPFNCITDWAKRTGAVLI